MRDVENLNDVLQLKWHEMTKERIAQEQMVVDYLAGECEHPI